MGFILQMADWLDDNNATVEERKWADLSAIATCIMRALREHGTLTVVHDVSFLGFAPAAALLTACIILNAPCPFQFTAQLRNTCRYIYAFSFALLCVR